MTGHCFPPSDSNSFITKPEETSACLIDFLSVFQIIVCRAPVFNESHFKNYMLKRVCSLPSCLFIYSLLLDLFYENEHFTHMYVCEPHVPGTCGVQGEVLGPPKLELEISCELIMRVLVAEPKLSTKATSVEPSLQLLPAGLSYQH